MRSRSVNKRSISNGEANFVSGNHTMNTNKMGIEESNTTSPISGGSSSNQALHHHHHQTSNHLSQRRGTFTSSIASATSTNSTGLVLSSPPTSGSMAALPRTPTRSSSSLSSWMKKWFLRLLVCITIIWWMGTFSIQILSLGSSSTTSSLSSTTSDIPNKKDNNDALLFDQDGTSSSNSETFQTAMQTLTHKLLQQQQQHDELTKKSTQQQQDKVLRARKQEKMSSDNNADTSLNHFLDHNIQPKNTPKNSTFRIVYDAKHVDVVADAMFDVERKAFRSIKASHVVLAGIVRHTNEMSKSVWTSLIELNCFYNISIHIVVAEGFDVGYETYQAKKQNLLQARETSCAPFILHPEPIDLVSSYTMRVDKIAILRDYQRELLQKAWYNQLHGNRHKARIIFADLDLLSFPNTSMVMSQLNDNSQSSNFDVICSAGVMHRPFGYYDIFATILQDNTFVYPVRGRLTQSSSTTDNKELIRSDDIYGKVTQYDLLSYFEQQSLLLSQQQQREGTAASTSSFTTFANTTSNVTTIPQGNVDPLNITLYNSHYLSQFDTIVPVQSCFGGFAVYNATKFFHSRCSYSAPYKFYNQDPSMKKRPKLAHEEQSIFQQYSSKRSKRPCEHVVFHKCLHRVYYDHYGGGQDSDSLSVHEDPIKIGILPSWRTEWDAPLRQPHGNETHVLQSSPSRHDGLNTYYNQRLLGERLISANQRYTLRIHETGQLVIEDWLSDLDDIPSARNETNNNHTRTRAAEQRHLRLPLSKMEEEKSSSLIVDIDAQSFSPNYYEPSPINKGRMVWSNPINTFETESLSLLPSSGWTHMFLWLQDNGSIKLIQHIPLSTIKTQYGKFHKRYCENVKSETPVTQKTPCICQVKIDGCEILLWSVAAPPSVPSAKKKRSSKSFALHLNDDASLVLATGDEGSSNSKKCITVIVPPNASHNATTASEL